MNNHSKQHFLYRLINNQSGAAALLTVVVLTAFVTVTILAVALQSLNALEVSGSENASTNVILAAESCIDEGIMRILRDNTYAGEVLTIDNSVCTLVVTGMPCGSCTLEATTTDTVFTRSLQVDATFTGSSYEITQWSEIE